MCGFVSLLEVLFSCRREYLRLREVLSDNNGGVASFHQVIFDVFDIFLKSGLRGISP